MGSERARWRKLLRPGDWLTILLGLAFSLWSFTLFWHSGTPDGAIIRAGGKIVHRTDLSKKEIIDVPGPLGTTTIEIEPGRARVAADPGPRQYCVRQGWLTRPGAVAICAPNEISLTLTGRGSDYDSLNY